MGKMMNAGRISRSCGWTGGRSGFRGRGRTRWPETAALCAILLSMIPTAASAVLWDGTLKIGWKAVEPDGRNDESIMQEAFNIYDGFHLSQILLNGRFDPKNRFRLNLLDMNQDSRKGQFDWYTSGLLKLYGRYDQDRWVFDRTRDVTSMRKDWRGGIDLTPRKWLVLRGYYNNQVKDGNRWTYPVQGIESALGTRYDYTLQTGRVEAEARKDGKAFALAWNFTDYKDEILQMADRRGDVFSARLFYPLLDPIKLRSSFRGAYGKHKLSETELDYELSNFQYTGILGPYYNLDLKYRLFLQRINHAGTGVRTDNVRNDLDLTYNYKYGNISGGWGKELNDDDRSLTDYTNWRASAMFRHGNRVLAKLAYASRNKADEEKRTLLQDIELDTFRAKLQGRFVPEVLVGVRYVDRLRKLPDLGVEADGSALSVYGAWDFDIEEKARGDLGVDFTMQDEEYENLEGRFDLHSKIVTSHLHLWIVDNLYVGTALSWVDIKNDLNIEKGIWSIDIGYTLLEHFRAEVGYMGFTYDDFNNTDIFAFYTSNIWRIDIAYNFSLGEM